MIKSLYARIVLSFIGVVSLSLVVGGSIINYFYENRIDTLVQDKMIVHAQSMIRAYKQLGGQNGSLFMEASGSIPFYAIQIYDNREQQVYTSGTEPAQELPDIQAGIRHVLKSKQIYRDVSKREDHITIGLPFELGGLTHVLFMTAQLDFFLSETGTQIQYLQLFVFVLGSVLVVIAARYIVRPLRLLIQASQTVSRGNFEVDLHSTRNDDIGQLTRSFKAMASELGRMDGIRRRFVSDVSHELGTPLTNIRGYAHALRHKRLDEASRNRLLGIIEEESDRMSRMCGDLLQLTSLEHEQQLSSVRSFRLDEQLRQAVIRLEPKWSEFQLEMQLRLEEVTITADEDKLFQVWLNLIGNSIKFSSTGGRIILTARQTGQVVSMSVTDNGIGVPGGELSRIFKPFYKVDPSRERQVGGHGLGLSIVRQIVDLHYGKVEVTSQPGIETTFTVILPLRYMKL
ncbi:sensor histidine kinase [Paenibacillus tuaregi]|uniref:sensor histidine kinase n=1 Tax=Paenibacillus tuaregi TaxID=1816681 RepID=UPI0009ED8217|nr:HAMP domain-containing sensor histidine kinase [Paenibacillus tuaregi]